MRRSCAQIQTSQSKCLTVYWPGTTDKTHSVVVATGLMALVDDCIKRHFSSKQHAQLHIPLIRSASLKMNMEYIGPKRLIDEMFSRNTRRSEERRVGKESRVQWA